MTLTIAAAQDEFDARVTYLNTATLGLPPRRSRLALQQALTDWQDGTANPQASRTGCRVVGRSLSPRASSPA